jgi:DNA-directed RNA polymerase omega subunit
VTPRLVERAARAIPNRFALVNVVARRADEIRLGSEGRALAASGKPVSVAIAEVARGETWIAGTPPLLRWALGGGPDTKSTLTFGTALRGVDFVHSPSRHDSVAILPALPSSPKGAP